MKNVTDRLESQHPVQLGLVVTVRGFAEDKQMIGVKHDVRCPVDPSI